MVKGSRPTRVSTVDVEEMGTEEICPLPTVQPNGTPTYSTVHLQSTPCPLYTVQLNLAEGLLSGMHLQTFSYLFHVDSPAPLIHHPLAVISDELRTDH